MDKPCAKVIYSEESENGDNNMKQKAGNETSEGKRTRRSPPLACSDSPTWKNPLVKTFATKLLIWRTEEGKTLKQTANALDMSIAIVCEWEHGRRFPFCDHLLALSKLTGIPAWEFIRS